MTSSLDWCFKALFRSSASHCVLIYGQESFPPSADRVAILLNVDNKHRSYKPVDVKTKRPGTQSIFDRVQASTMQDSQTVK